jgi:hypothetical protein
MRGQRPKPIINPRARVAFATLQPNALVVVLGAPSWLSDSPYLKASATAGLFCDNAVGALVPSFVGALVRPPVVRSGPLRLVTFGVLRGPDAEFGRTRVLGAAASDGDTAITAGGTIAAAEATCDALCWGPCAGRHSEAARRRRFSTGKVRGADFGLDCRTTRPDLGRDRCSPAQATNSNQSQFAVAFPRSAQYHPQKKAYRPRNGSARTSPARADVGSESKACLTLRGWYFSTRQQSAPIWCA